MNARQKEEVKDWGLWLLRRSSVVEFPDGWEYAKWVRSVASAAADGNEPWLERLENEFTQGPDRRGDCGGPPGVTSCQCPGWRE